MGISEKKNRNSYCYTVACYDVVRQWFLEDIPISGDVLVGISEIYNEKRVPTIVHPRCCYLLWSQIELFHFPDDMLCKHFFVGGVIPTSGVVGGVTPGTVSDASCACSHCSCCGCTLREAAARHEQRVAANERLERANLEWKQVLYVTFHLHYY